MTATTRSPDAPQPGGEPEILTRLLALTRGRWRPSVLIVEDHAEVADSLRRALAQMGAQAVVSHDGETSLKMAEVMHFDLVILDVLLPGQNGFEVFLGLRHRPTTRDVPIMLVTCVTDEASQARGRELGAAHYLCKPFELAEFQSQVERILRAEAERRTAEGDQRFLGN